MRYAFCFTMFHNLVYAVVFSFCVFTDLLTCGLYDFNAETSVGPKVKFWYLVVFLTVSFKLAVRFSLQEV